MSTLDAFEAFPKIPRLRRGVIITEKIDGTNAAVVVQPDGTVFAQSRTRIITAETAKTDNYGFAIWVESREGFLRDTLGVGRHFGEWWGEGIQRNYGISGRRFSLFNTKRWTGYIEAHPEVTEYGLGVVPIIGSGPMTDETIQWALNELRENGSKAAPGFMQPEGIVVFHTQSQSMFKVLLENDELPKSLVAGAA